ncbi:helix-turn-helix transcriptional regulator [Micromonospora sp. NPDC051296]|uniref:helix-turn-helix transcriptional regulator n=1 Tax=Micromonospora sp. NPDC051296 TaxID=3155046 RepID=UPI00344954A7
MAEATRVPAAERDSSGTETLERRSFALRSVVMDRIRAVQQLGVHDRAMMPFAEGLPAILDRLVVLERSTRSAVYNLQPQMFFDPLRRERDLNRRTRARKLKGHLIASPNDYLSLLAPCHPDTWVAPVHLMGIAIDERLALFPGPVSPGGRPTAWLCADRSLVAMFCEIWEEAKRQAVPIYDVPGLARLTERQVDIAALLARGAKDATVARLLGVSQRTVTSDIGRILDALGVSTRWEAGMIMGRACPGALTEHPAKC